MKDIHTAAAPVELLGEATRRECPPDLHELNVSWMARRGLDAVRTLNITVAVVLGIEGNSQLFFVASRAVDLLMANSPCGQTQQLGTC